MSVQSSFNLLYWPLSFLWLGSKIIRIIITFILNSLRGCSIHIQICSMLIQNTPRATSATILCSYLLIQVTGESYWLILILAHSCSSNIKQSQVLLYVHLKYVSGVALCTFKILRELFYLHHEGVLKIYIHELVLNITDHRRRELCFQHLWSK